MYRYEPAQHQLVDTKLLPVGKHDAPDWLTSTEVMVPSHDGVLVPLSIIHRRDIKLDGRNPAFISGYGAYGHSNPMRYDPVQLAWLERGGVLAVAHVRGGGPLARNGIMRPQAYQAQHVERLHRVRTNIWSSRATHHPPNSPAKGAVPAAS